MKKIYFALIMLFAFADRGFSQSDTLLYADFNDTTAATLNAMFTVYTVPNAPPGGDTTWVVYDGDGISDGSTAGTRSSNWFQNFAFAVADSLLPNGTDNFIMGSSSWTNDATTPIQNYLITPPIHIVDNTAMLRWKSASFQTPYYLDGYKVLISVTDDQVESFTDTVSVYAEYVSGAVTDFNFADYTFSPGFVAGMDGQYIEYDGDSGRFKCILRPDSVSLAAYSGKVIRVCFLADSHDDNLLSIDDVFVTGTHWDAIKEINANLSPFTISPNPANEFATINFSNDDNSKYTMYIYDMLGNVVKSNPIGQLSAGAKTYRFATNDIPAGNYSVTLKSDKSAFTNRLVIVK